MHAPDPVTGIQKTTGERFREVVIDNALLAEPVDAFGDPVEWFTPEELDIGLGRRHPYRGRGRAAEVERRMRPPVRGVRAWRDG
nr:hypothetical protein [Streptomyces sp. GMR22]